MQFNVYVSKCLSELSLVCTEHIFLLCGNLTKVYVCMLCVYRILAVYMYFATYNVSHTLYLQLHITLYLQLHSFILCLRFFPCFDKDRCVILSFYNMYFSSPFHNLFQYVHFIIIQVYIDVYIVCDESCILLTEL